MKQFTRAQSHGRAYFYGMNHAPQLLIEAIDAFASLPGIGKKTALRLALHLMNQDEEKVIKMADALKRFRTDIRSCQRCHNLSQSDFCPICLDSSRKKTTICIVESVRDILAIEDTHQFSGVYHVLGGVINPLEGIGPENLNMDTLVERVKAGDVEELILAISPTIEGDTTIYYLSRLLHSYPIKISTIARGVAFGGELEYADEITLGRSILSRIPYSHNNGV